MFHLLRHPPRQRFGCRVTVGRRRQSRCRATDRSKVARVNSRWTTQGYGDIIYRTNHVYRAIHYTVNMIQGQKQYLLFISN